MSTTVPPISLYRGDDWTFLLTATDGGTGLSASLGDGGTGYTTAPLVLIDAPPPNGRQAVAIATISAGAVTGLVFSDRGAYAPSSPPAITLTGGGGSGATALAIVGNPIDLTNCLLGVELFQPASSAAIDITSYAAITGAVRGQIAVTVPHTMTRDAVISTLPSRQIPARVHVFYIDATGKRLTIGVIPVIPQAP